MNEEAKKEIAVIGDEDFTTGFRLAGIGRIHGKENYAEKIRQMLQEDDLGIVVADQDDLEELPDRTRKDVEQSVDPVVVALSETGTTEHINEKIRKVIGADIT